MSKVLKQSLAIAAAAAMTAVQCGAAGLFTSAAGEKSVAATSFPYVIEGENLTGADTWTAIYQNEMPGYSGEGFWYLTASPASFEVTVPEDGMYSIVVHGAQILNEEGRQQAFEVNGVKYTTIADYSREWKDYNFGVVRLRKGANTIKFISEYGYMAVDYVTVSNAVFPDLSNSTGETCDPDATAEAKSLMKYLNSVYGEYILSGQQEIYGGGHSISTSIRYDAQNDVCVDEKGNTYEIDRDSKDKDEQGNTFYWHCTGPDGQVYTYSTQNHNYGYNDYETECRYLKELTGHYPAIRGFDFNCHNPGFAWEDGVADRMISWAKDKNGICTASWHVTVPKDMSEFEVDKDGNITKISNDWQAYTYATQTDFVTANVMVEGTKEYYFFKEAVKLLAGEIGKLQDAGVPLIFRPFHEAEGNPSKTTDPIDGSGAWFWWSKEGAKVYNELWKYLYKTLTEEYGLHNIIWEQNLYAWSPASASWYTGDDWVDIVGFDKYNTEYNRHDGKTSGPNEDAESGIFWSLVDYVDNHKMVSMPENSTIPSMENMLTENAMWLYFCTWYDETSTPKFISGEDYQNADTVKAVFQSEKCITLDELPADLYKSSGSDEPSTVVYGDANCDGLIQMADAVLIMQVLSNGDRFAENGTDKTHITSKGMKNADCHIPGSGLTPSDALAVQTYLLKKNDLPLNK
ncbi:MAG: beta-mannosidase [Ruminococcus sp.]|nr:beta-mannosidase [Ruminococcus sp.]